MKRQMLTAVTVSVLHCMIFSSVTIGQDNLDGWSKLVAMAQVRKAVNEERAQNGGLRALAVDTRLMRAAENYAVIMANHTEQYPSHDIGKSLSDRFRDEGIRGETRENVHRWHSGDIKEVVDQVVRHDSYGWMHYVTRGRGRVHREAILNPRMTHMGIGVTRSARDNKLYFCLIVGTAQESTAQRTFPSGGGLVESYPVTVQNDTGQTLKYRLYTRHPHPSNRGSWTAVLTLGKGQRRVHYLPTGSTLQATEAFGRSVSESVPVQLRKTHHALGQAWQTLSPRGVSRQGFSMSWYVR